MLTPCPRISKRQPYCFVLKSFVHTKTTKRKQRLATHHDQFLATGKFEKRKHQKGFNKKRKKVQWFFLASLLCFFCQQDRLRVFLLFSLNLTFFKKATDDFIYCIDGPFHFFLFGQLFPFTNSRFETVDYIFFYHIYYLLDFRHDQVCKRVCNFLQTHHSVEMLGFFTGVLSSMNGSQNCLISKKKRLVFFTQCRFPQQRQGMSLDFFRDF